MADNHWKKVTVATAREIVPPDLLEPSSEELLETDMRPEAYIGALVESGSLSDAVKVMTRVLPVREAVWWACVCARQISALAESDVEMAALNTAETWVFEPNEKNREKAFEFVKSHDAKGAGVLCAVAASFSEGNAPLGDGHHVDLDAAVFPQIIDGVVMISAMEKQGEEIKDRLRAFIASGEDIARGGNGELKARAE
jgi:hypothetical protein